MSTWIEASLRDAVAALIQSGEKELAAGLFRLLADPGVTSMQLFRYSEVADLADKIYDCETLEELHGLVPAIASALGVDHCTIHCVRERGATIYRTRVLTSYDEAWVSEYVGKRYYTIDPVMARCQAEGGTFFWDELPVPSPIGNFFFETAVRHGVGPSGITAVLSDPDGNTVAVTLASTLEPAAFRRAFKARMSDFVDISAILVEVFADLAREQAPSGLSATEDQMKVLRALVCGKSLADIERMHYSYGSFATVEKSILQTFGARTLHQAAAIAARLGLLDELPYFDEDIHRSAAA